MPQLAMMAKWNGSEVVCQWIRDTGGQGGGGLSMPLCASCGLPGRIWLTAFRNRVLDNIYTPLWSSAIFVGVVIGQWLSRLNPGRTLHGRVDRCSES